VGEIEAMKKGSLLLCFLQRRGEEEEVMDNYTRV
jgi:hypothetical protein